MTDSKLGKGIVVRQKMGHHYVDQEGREWDCRVSSRLRKDLIYPEASAGSRRHRVDRVRGSRTTDPITIGDDVRFEPGDDWTGMIHEVRPRRNKISRQASGTSRKEQLLAANIDRVIAIFAVADPIPEWHLLDRMLGIAEWADLPAVVCVNKQDLDGSADVDDMIDVYERIGYRVLRTSIHSDVNQEEFRALVSEGTSLFMGPSGVGKSSLLNWLQPGLQLRTGAVSHVRGEGRHTTSHLELVRLERGGLVGDIPGVREFQLHDFDEEDVPLLYREFIPFLNQCRFNNCTHVHEPHCAIKEAVEAGHIDPRRHASYLRLRQNP